MKVSAKQNKQLDLKIYPEAFAFILGLLGPSSKDWVIFNMGGKEWGGASVKGDFVALVNALDKSKTGQVVQKFAPAERRIHD